MVNVDPVATLSRRRHCGNPAGRAAALARAHLWGSAATPPWPQLATGDCLLTYQGRSAVAVLADCWRLGPGDEVLAPAYNCGTEIDPFLARGVNVTLYAVNGTGRVEFAEIRRRITTRTRAVYVTHYFGFPQPLDELLPWCRANSIRLIEDCALALFSRDAYGCLGTRGDAAIFSFTKSLAVPDGGALVCRTRDAARVRLRNPPLWCSLRQALRLVKAQWLRAGARYGWAPTPFDASVGPTVDKRDEIGPQPDMPADYYFDARRAHWGMSRSSQRLLGRIAPEQIVAARRRNYARLHARIENLPGVRPLHADLPAGVCPLALPIIVADRRAWVHGLRARGIAAVAWWSGFHRGLDWREHANAAALKTRIVALPIHQELNDGQIDYIAACVGELAHGARVDRAPAALSARSLSGARGRTETPASPD